MSVNKVILLGNVGKTPEIRYIGTRPVASFTLATNERAHKDSQGNEIPERTEWHNIIMYGHLAEIAERYVEKGVKLYIEGKLSYRVWQDRNTIKHNVTEIIAENFEILSRPQKSSAN